jgi:hypothetical protein
MSVTRVTETNLRSVSYQRGKGVRSGNRDETDRRRFLDVVGHVLDRFPWRCHAYCLMGNHYHLLVETLRANLGPLPASV